MYAIIDTLTMLKGEPIVLNGILFFLLVGVYFASIKLFIYRYKKKYHKLPLFNGMFKLYNKNLISNAPSKREKAFYIATNKLTVVFNSLLVVTVLSFVMLCFFR